MQSIIGELVNCLWISLLILHQKRWWRPSSGQRRGCSKNGWRNQCQTNGTGNWSKFKFHPLRMGRHSVRISGILQHIRDSWVRFFDLWIEQKLTQLVELRPNKPFIFLTQSFNSLFFPKLCRPSPVYNEAEINYLKKLIEKIVMDETHSISRMSAVQLCSAPLTQSQSTSKKVTKQRAEELIEEWAEGGYFMNRGDLITLGPRGIGEFRDTFRTKFTDYIDCCRLCNEIALQVNKSIFETVKYWELL